MTKVKIRAILTPEYRLSFCNLFEAKADMNGIIRFQMEMLFPKERGGAQFKEMLDLYNEVLKNDPKLQGAGPTPRPFKDAIIDGNSKKQEGRHGMFMLKANASVEINGKPNKPRVLLPNRMPATSADVYEGCWCRAIITAYPYVAYKDGNPKLPMINRGVNFNMMVVQKVRDDKPFASFVSEAEQDDILKAAPLEGEDDDDLNLLA